MIPKRFKNDIVSTIIGEDTNVKGEVYTQRSICVEGCLDGGINAQGEVYVGEKSQIKGNVVGKKVIIAGEVSGNIEATNGLEITKTGKVYGDIIGDQLTIEEGAIYKGRVNMDIISSQNDYEGKVDISKA